MNDRLLERLVGGLAAFLLLSALVTGISSRGVSAQAATPTTVSTPVATDGVQSSSQTSIGSVTAAQQQLADKYAPIAMLKAQTSNCDKSGEGYFPVTVDFLFDNPDIALKAKGDGNASQDAVIQQGITPQDLVNAGENTYLDFPGNPRDPGCELREVFQAEGAR